MTDPNDARDVLLSEKIRRGMMQARENGKKLGRPARVDVDAGHVQRLRDLEFLSWNRIAGQLRAGRGTVLRAYQRARPTPAPSQKGYAGVL
jgi:DNA invertase Pin-like site-specific DNA recombinase